MMCRCLHVLATGNSAAVNVRVPVSLNYDFLRVHVQQWNSCIKWYNLGKTLQIEPIFRAGIEGRREKGPVSMRWGALGSELGDWDCHVCLPCLEQLWQAAAGHKELSPCSVTTSRRGGLRGRGVIYIYS